MRRWLALSCFLCACATEAVPGDNAVISCTTSFDCPADWLCLEGTNTCSPFDIEEVVTETAPVTTIEEFPSDRRFVSVPFDVGLIDLNASDETPEPVQLELEYIVDGIERPEDNGNGGWWSGTLIYPDPLTLTSPDELTTVSVRWNAIRDTNAADVPELVSASVDANGLGQFSDVVAFIPEMRLRVRAVDDEGNRGPWVTTPSFALGNEVPRVQNVFVPVDVDGGLVPIEFQLSDSAGDPAEIFVQFRTEQETQWQDATIVLGEQVDVLTSPVPERRVLVWDTTRELNDGGIGPTRRERVEIRIQAKDTPGANITHHGDWFPANTALTLDNTAG
ncbi:MAG: hypothetical protein AAF654_04405 [Myxococcota bacterium]